MSDILDYKQSYEQGQVLADLCRAYEVDPAWLEESRHLDQLLSRVLVDCERRLRELPKPVHDRISATDGSTGSVDDQKRLRSLISFAREAVTLRACDGATLSLVSGVEDLERIRLGEKGEAEQDDAQVSVRALELCSEIARLCHKINNPLTSLLGRSQMLQLQPNPTPDKLGQAIEVIEESARRVATGIQELAQVVDQGKEDLLKK